MSRKSLAIGLIIGIVIALPIGYFLAQILSNLAMQQSTQQSTSTETTISDIIQHPAEYVGKQVGLKGFVSSTVYTSVLPNIYEISDVSTGQRVYLINLPNGFSPSNVVYSVTGIVLLSYTATWYGGSTEFSPAINVTSISLAS
jgi:ABC-type lipoprotein release transport system permease subunit